ncbi:MAG TPA: lasso peptide biosynthesis B2 protein [Pyrinomonadaceae bacterium]
MSGIIVKTFIGSTRLCTRAARLVLREPGKALLLARMTAWVGTLSLLIRALPLPMAMRALTPLRRRAPSHADAAILEARIAELLDMLLAADVLFLTPTCWKRAPVLYRFLALEGIETRVVFGVRKESQGLLAGHAWLEAGGRPLFEKTLPDYKVTFSFPA